MCEINVQYYSCGFNIDGLVIGEETVNAMGTLNLISGSCDRRSKIRVRAIDCADLCLISFSKVINSRPSNKREVENNNRQIPVGNIASKPSCPDIS